MQPRAQPHILWVQHRDPRLLPCVSARRKEGEKRRKEDGEREVEQLKSKQTRAGGDQRQYWTVERICVTAISKTITPTAPTRGTRNLLLQTDLTDLTLSHRTPLCWGGRPHRMPFPNSGQATSTASCTAHSLRRQGLSPAYRRQGICFPLRVCGTLKTFVGLVCIYCARRWRSPATNRKNVWDRGGSACLLTNKIGENTEVGI